MEEIENRWRKLSLSDTEGRKVDLSKERKQTESVLAAKFLMRRVVNIEAVARTFQPIWHTGRNFEVTSTGDNLVLIAFELKVDVEKVLQGEPWTFDWHLVVLQRYDGITPVANLSFDKASFWVQIHNLPFSLLTVEAALSIGETIGTVMKSRDSKEMRGGNFMRVRVAIDIKKPLCRGRKISWDQTGEGSRMSIFHV